jgi:AAA family ATP:ADP antiporter
MLSHAGDVATWSGVVTGGLMLLSPLLFERLGWRGVAGATPKILLYGGSAFFAACIAYQVGLEGRLLWPSAFCAFLITLLDRLSV